MRSVPPVRPPGSGVEVDDEEAAGRPGKPQAVESVTNAISATRRSASRLPRVTVVGRATDPHQLRTLLRVLSAGYSKAITVLTQSELKIPFARDECLQVVFLI